MSGSKRILSNIYLYIPFLQGLQLTKERVQRHLNGPGSLCSLQLSGFTKALQFFLKLNY